MYLSDIIYKCHPKVGCLIGYAVHRRIPPARRWSPQLIRKQRMPEMPAPRLGDEGAAAAAAVALALEAVVLWVC